VKQRGHCEHSYVLIKTYENVDVEPFAGGAFTAGPRRILVYRCELCGKKKRMRA